MHIGPGILNKANKSESNSRTAPMGVEIYAGDLLSTNKLKNTDATSNLHNDQRNIEQSQISKADGPSVWVIYYRRKIAPNI